MSVFPCLVSTIGSTYAEEDYRIIDRMLKEGINYFRVNFAKYIEEDKLVERTDFFRLMKLRYGNDIKIMIDLAFPRKKPRLFFDCDFIDVNKDDCLLISSCTSKQIPGICFADIPSIGIITKKDQIIPFDDGKASFKVIDICDSDTISIQVDRSIRLYNRKSLYLNVLNRVNILSSSYIKLIKEINPNVVAFSFVENSYDIISCINNIDMPNVEVISKIETPAGVNSISEIADFSDIMLGRGDLCLYADYSALFQIQKKVAKETKLKKKKLYIATGILQSLLYSAIPSQSDIIDLTVLFSLHPDGLIFNSGLLDVHLGKVLDVLHRIYSKISDNI